MKKRLEMIAGYVTRAVVMLFIVKCCIVHFLTQSQRANKLINARTYDRVIVMHLIYEKSLEMTDLQHKQFLARQNESLDNKTLLCFAIHISV